MKSQIVQVDMFWTAACAQCMASCISTFTSCKAQIEPGGGKCSIYVYGIVYGMHAENEEKEKGRGAMDNFQRMSSFSWGLKKEGPLHVPRIFILFHYGFFLNSSCVVAELPVWNWRDLALARQIRNQQQAFSFFT